MIMLTTILTALIAIFLILTSAIIMPIYGQAKQNTTGLGGQQGQTINDVRQSRLVLLQGIDNAIVRLVESTPGTSAAQFNTTHIAQLLKTDQLCAAIVELTKLQTHVIDVFGQEAANKEVVPQIQNLIAALKTQESCSSPSPPPHASNQSKT